MATISNISLRSFTENIECLIKDARERLITLRLVWVCKWNIGHQKMFNGHV